MRGLIIDHARNRKAQKRGGQFEITSLENHTNENVADVGELMEISEVLDKLAQLEPSLAEIVDLKVFCGFSFGRLQPCEICPNELCRGNGRKPGSISTGSFARRCHCEESMPAVNPDQWYALSPYLDQALTLSEADRARWLEALAAENPTLASQLKEFLEEHRAAEQKRYLDTGPTMFAQSHGLAGQMTGAYKLISVIGQGGMGTVWLAERADGRFERKAAVKFLSAALIGHGGEERFKREGAILGRFSHPSIAELLDAGVSASGHPFIILEYVEGEPIDHYCDERKLDVPGRVRLFLEVLGAVAHAHANLIVHRDIKPSHVLVTKEARLSYWISGSPSYYKARDRKARPPC
jgi:hypothetical protein